MSTPNSNAKQAQSQARDLNQRVLTCLHKLSDRDTHAAAASELESISKTLTPSSLPSFLSSISATDTSDMSPVRRQCVRLISILSDHHKNSLSPHLSKLLKGVVRRLRDPDSAVRAACVAASLSLSSNLTSVPFSSISKPFIEALFIEQDLNTQNGVALCLAAVIEGSRSPDVASLRRILPKLEKLAKSESFKAKAGVLVAMRSIVGVTGVLSGGGRNVVRDLVGCLVGFLSCHDWAARKAAAAALVKIAVVEKGALSEYKASCLKTFEDKRFDKVKAAREMMNEMIEAWKEIPDQVEASVSPQHESFNENAIDGRKRTSLNVNESKTGPALFRKLDHKKEANSNVKIAKPLDGDEIVLETEEEEIYRFTKPEIRRALFKVGVQSCSRVGPSEEAVSNETGDIYRNQRDCEELFLIRKQLVQIENQQSNLLDVLKSFIESSQNGMHSLEARVHGLELAIDEISFDLAASTGRMSQNNTSCCKLLGSEFLSSKLWRKTEARSSIFSLQNRSFKFQGAVMNPLAEIPKRVSSSGVVKNVGV